MKRFCPLLVCILFPFWVMGLWHFVASAEAAPFTLGARLEVCSGKVCRLVRFGGLFACEITRGHLVEAGFKARCEKVTGDFAGL